MTVVAALVLAIDMADHQDEWDGIGAFFAVIIAAPCVLICGCADLGCARQVPSGGGPHGRDAHHGGAARRHLVVVGAGPLLLGATLLVTAFVAPSRTR